MSSRLDSFRLSRFSITTQLLLWFLLISLIPCVVLTGVISYLSTDSLKKTVRLGLLAIADAKTTQLDIYVRERRADLNVASRAPSLVDAVQKLSILRRKEPLDSPALRRGGARRAPVRLAHFAESFGYANYFVFDTDGTLLFQLKPDLDSVRTS